MNSARLSITSWATRKCFWRRASFPHRDLHQLYHELRTPVNHIIGYSELLQDQAAELGAQQPIADLKKIHAAAGEWLALMEAYLVASPTSEGAAAGENDAGVTLNAGLGFK